MDTKPQFGIKNLSLHCKYTQEIDWAEERYLDMEFAKKLEAEQAKKEDLTNG